MNNNNIPFKDDPCAFMAYVAQISPSQEDFLRHCRFVGESDVSQDDVVNPDGVLLNQSSLPSTGGNSVDPTPIVVLSDDDGDGKGNSIPQDDAFYTPPEQSSLLTSSEGFEICTLNQMPDIDEILETGCEDLGRDYDLGFPVVESESLSSKDDTGESVPKKLKLSEEKLSFGNSSGGCFGFDSANSKGKMVCDTQDPSNFARHGQPQHSCLDSEERFGRVRENLRGVPCSDERNESTENAIGISDRNKSTDEELWKELLRLIHSFLKCAGKERGLEIGKDQQGQKSKAVVDDNGECIDIGESTQEICETENLASTREKVSEAVEGRRRADKQPSCLMSTEMTLESENEKGRQEQGSKTGKGTQQEHKAPILNALRVRKELETENKADQDYNSQGASLWEFSMSLGYTYPRPRWWSEKRGFMNSKKK